MFAILLSTLFSISCSCDEKPSNILGEWTIEKANFNSPLECRGLLLEKNKLTLYFDKNETKESQITIDYNASPIAIDLMAGKGKALGILELKNEKLYFCLNLEGTKRPTEFKSQVGDALLVLTRKK